MALGQCLVETLLCCSLVPAEVAAPGSSLEEGVSIVLVILVTAGQHAPLAELLDHPVGVEADLAVLDVEEVEIVTVLGNRLHPAV